MNPDIQKLLERQSQWQKNRKNLSWPEKIRMAQNIRDSILSLNPRLKEKNYINDILVKLRKNILKS